MTYADALDHIPLAQLFCIAAAVHERNGGEFEDLDYGQRDEYDELPENPEIPPSWPTQS